MSLAYVVFTDGPTTEEMAEARESLERGVPCTLSFGHSCYMNEDMTQRHHAAGMTGIATSINPVPGDYGKFFVSLRDVNHPVGPIIDTICVYSSRRAAMVILPR